MGAHIAGFIGKITQQLTSLTIYRITGLEPSRPMFYHQVVMETNRLSSMDATLVDVIHTNSIQFGFPIPIGHIDFFVNGGKTQPGCSIGKF